MLSQTIVHGRSTTLQQADGDRPLIEKIRSGDYNAFEELFRSYHANLVRFACFFVGGVADAEEIVQEVFERLWMRRRDLHVEGGIRPYLFGAVRNHARNFLRKRQTRSRRLAFGLDAVESPASSESPESDFRMKRLTEVLQNAVAEMPERRRMVYLLSRQEHLTYAEIAAVLGISRKTVDNHMGAALKHLRDRLASWSER